MLGGNNFKTTYFHVLSGSSGNTSLRNVKQGSGRAEILFSFQFDGEIMSHWSQARKVQYVDRKHSYTFSSKGFCRRMDRIPYFKEFVHPVFFKEEHKVSTTEDVPSSHITTLLAKYCL